MGFDVKSFSRAKFAARTEVVEVPEMAEFNNGNTLNWTVRGLTGDELYRVKAAAERNEQLQAFVKAISTSGVEQLTAIREALGLVEEMQEEHVKRLEMLIIASVDPEIDRPMAVKFAGAYPVAFGRLTDAILKLTGMGAVAGKSKGSGEKVASETP